MTTNNSLLCLATTKRFGWMVIPIVVFILLFFAIPPHKQLLYPKFSSLEIYDRHGKLLRTVLSNDYKTSIRVSLDEVSPYVIKATIQREDKRFYSHHGVDLLSIARAVYSNLRKGRVVSGGSTITMQTAKIILGHKKRNLFTKLLEAVYAIKLELHLSKREILEVYLNRVPYGNQVYGIEAASRLYFNKHARQLSLGEACILTTIPRSPVALNPYTYPERLLKEKEMLLRLLLKGRIIDSLSFSCALKEGLNILPRWYQFFAPHFTDYILKGLDKWGLKGASRITTTLDLNLHEDMEKHLYTTLRSLKPYNINQGGIIVMDTATGEIRSMVGSKDYFEAREGQVNACLSLRQPGSAIKPFLYILALSSGVPASYLLQDRRMEFTLPDGTRFAPRNYGDRYHGQVRLREALACSLNVPTVYLLQQLGVQQFYNLLKELQFKGLTRETNFYGLSLGLGSGEVQLLELANAYRAIARGGVWEKEKAIPSISRGKSKRVFSREAAYITTDILSDNPSRIKSFGSDSPLNLPFPCASKTGTSKDFKDNWCLGFTKDYVVGVWVGNFDGSPMKGVSGISGAAPLFRDIMMELHRQHYPEGFDSPSSLVHQKICEKSGKLAGHFCPEVVDEIFIKNTQPQEECRIHRSRGQKLAGHGIRIVNPADGDIFKIDPQVSYKSQGINFKIKADEGVSEVIFRLNGKLLARGGQPFNYLWSPVTGEHRLEVIGLTREGKKRDEVSFRVL